MSRQNAVDMLVSGSVESTFAAERHSVDAIFETLADPGRRYVVTYLLQSDGTVSLAELVDYSLEETGAPDDEQLRQKIAVKLTHTVLPALAENGYVQYDMEQQRIEQTDRTAVLGPYLELAKQQERRARELRSES